MTDENEAEFNESELLTLRSRNIALEAEIRDAHEVADRRFINAELKNEALRRGIVDLDGLKLIDATHLRVAKTGETQGVSSLIAQLKQEKPWLFGTENSSSLATVPPSAPAGNKQAMDMTLQEWRVARAELVRRR